MSRLLAYVFAFVLLGAGRFAEGAPSHAFSCRGRADADQAGKSIETTLAGVPAIVRVPRRIARPPIILWHGFGPPASESALADALPLDDVPAIKVFLGLPLFGKRMPAGGAAELGRRQHEDFATLLFEPTVLGAANELPAVVGALRDRGCLRADERIDLFGFSAGGAAVLFALAEHAVAVDRSVVINASTGLGASVEALERATNKPYAWTPDSRALALRSDATGRAADIAASVPPALLIVQGADDKTLDPQRALALYNALEIAYGSANAGRVQLALVTGMAHPWLDAASLDDVRRLIASWFDHP
jgi:pimeloyl-ACP methyl ester carboxylesterase